MLKACIVAALIIAALPGQARAADEVLIDPDSPSGAEYQIPFAGERESARAKQSRRNSKRSSEKAEAQAQSSTDDDQATSGAGERRRERKRNLGRLFGEGIGPNASTEGGLAGSSADLRPGDQGESAPVWTVVVWVGALLTALLLLAGGVLFVLPEGARTKALGRFGGFGNRLLARLRVRRPGS